MGMELLERDTFLLTLDELLRQAGDGLGRTVLVSGDAGIGKTSVVERFIEQSRSATRPLWGSCEALFTPRPLGPLYDIASQAQTPLRDVLEGGANRAPLFAAVLDELSHGPLPTVLVIEDIHWADEATLDLIKFLARRMHRTSSLLILTYRDDDVGKDHPLWLVLGDLPARDVTRLRLPLLSERAVVTLAQQSGRPAENLYITTGGNPFFLTEVLASDTPGVPTSVRDAVLARIARLSHEAQCFLELASVVPTKIEWRTVEAMSAVNNVWLDECLAAGILHLEDGSLGFRHELARQAMEGTLSPARKRMLNAQILRVCIDQGEEGIPLARLVHHAAQAEDGALVLRFAPAAARQASAQGAHREAAAHYVTALRYADSPDAEQQANLLEALSHEYYLIGQFADAVAPQEGALALWRALERSEKVGPTLRHLSRLSWFLTRIDEAEHYAAQAIEILESLPPGRELAMAYCNLSHLRMLQSDNANAVHWGVRALALAERLHDLETLCYALNNIASAELNDGNEQGWAKLERSLRVALEHGYEDHVARAYANLAEVSVRTRNYLAATDYLREGMAYCTEHDLGSSEQCLRGHQARARFYQGDWLGADEDATAILNVSWATGTNRGPALTVLGQVRVRRGDPGVEAVLDEARDVAVATGDLERIVPVAAARAEWRWLQGNLGRCLVEAAAGFRQAQKYNDPWSLGEAAFWVWRGGGLCEPPEGIPAPFALHMAGDWRAAADAWEQLGCPYEQALALMDGDEAAQRAALGLFEHLGAAPAAEMVRRRLRTAGARGLPRGPRPTTRGNPLGLTARQLEILLLLVEGLHNPEIADRLSTTPKTVEHHVSAVLAKLEARSRAEAVRVAYQLGLVPQAEPERTSC
jgi:DNA-binding CsgD family transcriptional regulator/tetratricopeptide (TPR) repeat protein/GTPase SAR1 family protein